MKRLRLTLCLAAALIAAGCSPSADRLPPSLTQFSSIDALMAGDYDGSFPVSILPRSGEIGLGTFDKLDGEMILLDGKVWQARADGTTRPAPPDITTPFACVARLSRAARIELPVPRDMAGTLAAIDEAVRSPNSFVALRVDGAFDTVRARSVPPQSAPYPPLTEAAKNQPEFTWENVRGTLVGFRCPPFAKGVNVPGWHLHFLSDDRTKGGHVLAFTAREGVAHASVCAKFTMHLPASDTFQKLDLSKDRSQELHKVERQTR